MRKVCIITGATSGIGLELTKLYSCHDIDLLLISSNIENLKKTKTLLDKNIANIDILEMDLTKEIEIDKIKEKIKDKKLHCLINNAGFGDLGEFINCDIEKAKKMININIKSLTTLSHFFLNEVKDTKENVYLLNVASIAGFMQGPLMATYYATKAYVLSLTRAIRFENTNKKIKISCLCPGPTSTNFTKNFSTKPQIFTNIFATSASDVAITAYYGLKKGKEIIIPGVLNRLTIFLIRFIPNRLIEYITYRIMRTK